MQSPRRYVARRAALSDWTGAIVVSPCTILIINFVLRIAPSIIRAGVIDIGGNSWNDETDYRIADIIPHPKYTRLEKYHDLALLK